MSVKSSKLEYRDRIGLEQLHISNRNYLSGSGIGVAEVLVARLSITEIFHCLL